MILQTFKNKKGLIYGPEPKRIGCDKEGTLRIGTAEVSISPLAETIMPVLFNGSAGTYKATFTDKYGEVYDLGKIAIKAGRIVPPSDTAVELCELRYRAEVLEADNEAIRQEMRELRNIFDTNSLNFLIN